MINHLLMAIGLTDEQILFFQKGPYFWWIIAIANTWKVLGYNAIIYLAAVSGISQDMYEAADVDGANGWQKFKVITLQEIMPVLATVVTLRTIWVFYMYTEVALLSGQVKTISVYLYENAFSMRDMGKAAAISILLFAMIFGFIMLVRKKVFRYE